MQFIQNKCEISAIFPGGHFVHEIAPSSEKVPSGHLIHSIAPEIFE